MANLVAARRLSEQSSKDENKSLSEWDSDNTETALTHHLLDHHGLSSLTNDKPGQAAFLIHKSAMNTISNRKFSYASVKEDEDLPQSFNSSLSSKDFEEVEWIAAPCNQSCRTKGLCSSHSGGTHEQYVQTRLEGYARSNPDKLEKILGELDKRRKHSQLQSASRFSRFFKSIRPSRLIEWASEDDEAITLSEDEDVLISEDVATSSQQTTIEMLPEEILSHIFNYTTMDRTADPYARLHVDLCSLVLTSKAIKDAALPVMYTHVSFSQSRAFSKFCRTLSDEPKLGKFVRCLDFSHYSSIGFGRTRTVSNQTPYLTPITLKACLDQLPYLRAFLVHEHVDDELSFEVLSTLFQMPYLNALDLCACSSRPFTDAMSKLCESFPAGATSTIKRLGFHECTTLQGQVFEAILPQMKNLTHLDLAHTLVTDKALLSIPHTARITHLNLERCTRLTGGAVVEFLTKHPAVKDSIVYLNIMSDASRHRLLTESEVNTVLNHLPSSVRSLNIGGARLNSSHVPVLRKLSTHIEELGLRSANLSLGTDIVQLLNTKPEDSQPSGYRSSIRYLDLSNIHSVNQMSLCYSPTALTSASTMPLEVIEVGSEVQEQLKRRNVNVKKPEWTVRELGRRAWYVRQPKPQEGIVLDDGVRPWKMGAKWWGMKKIPMFEQDVGGMYGYFMFKRC